MMTREIVAGALGILSGFGGVLLIVWRYHTRTRSPDPVTPHQYISAFGFFYASFAIFCVLSITVTWLVSGTEAMVWKVIGLSVAPMLFLLQGLDSLIFERRTATRIGRCWQVSVGLLCLLIGLLLIGLYGSYLLKSL